MREIGKFCRIYCNEAHKRWQELLPHIEGWLNGTLSDSTGHSPFGQIFDGPMPDLSEKFLKKGAEHKPPVETFKERVQKAYVRMKEEPGRRNKREREMDVRSGDHK
jgi:hypothetical protein